MTIISEESWEYIIPSKADLDEMLSGSRGDSMVGDHTSYLEGQPTGKRQEL